MHRRRGYLAGVVAVCAGAVAAHHSPARFDMSKELRLDGTVSRYDFTNPHVYIYLDVTAADGRVATWELEASSTPNLVRRGWGPDSLRVGERVTALVNPPREPGAVVARAAAISWSDGRMLAVRGADTVAPPADRDARASSIVGTWLGRYGLAQVGTNLESWPLTAKGRAAQAAYDGSQNPHVDCVPVAAPSLMLYSNIYVVDLGDSRVTMDVEWMNVRRTIHLGNDVPEPRERANQGHSVGRWEGDTLVVETQGFADNGAGNAFEIPSGAQKRVIERFTLSGDGKRIDYEFELTDPEYLTEPVMGIGIWDYRPDLEPLPNQCDPEIARRFLDESPSQ